MHDIPSPILGTEILEKIVLATSLALLNPPDVEGALRKEPEGDNPAEVDGSEAFFCSRMLMEENSYAAKNC